MTALPRIFMLPLAACLLAAAAAGSETSPLPGGELRILDAEGAAAGICPLKHTAVEADIIGYIGRVTVRQVFHNPTDRKIEAVYVFPLPQDAAVDDMTMTVGERRIIGQIKERGEAREVYEAAKAAGHVASLLDQERPNIFTQSVANIEPGVEVMIEISYVETLKYDDGMFEWVFPMVVGPRYIPGGGSAPAPMTRGTDTPQVPDASRITPPVTPPGTRAGHDISVTVHLDGGTEVFDLESTLHEIDVRRASPEQLDITLRKQAEIPNRDFILHYRLAGERIGDAFLVHEDARGRFFTLVLHPPQRVAPQQIVPRELIFVLDTSGSMSGFPIDKAKETMIKLVGTMQPADTFNIITFAGDTHILWPEPQPATAQNMAAAQAFLAARQGGGGTEMMKAINAALVQTRSVQIDRLAPPIRVVCFMTDGYVGNDMAVIDAVQKNAGTTRVFSFGIGNSVNRLLLDGMALAGRGEVEYVTLASAADEAVERFHERVLAPVLTDIQIDWGNLPVRDVCPKLIPDLFSAKPIMIHGRLTGEPQGTIVLRGYTGAGPYEETIELSWPEHSPERAALPSLWARAQVADLMLRDYAGLQSGQFPADLKKQIIDLGLEYRLVTQFTSFVAVEQMTVTAGGEPVTIDVPVEMPDGVSYEGVFGGNAQLNYGLPLRAGKMGGAHGSPATAQPMIPGAQREARGKAVRRVAGESTSQDAATLGDTLWGDDKPAEPPTLEQVRQKLAESLRELAARVERDGQDGNLTLGKLRITAYGVDVLVYLSDTSDETMKTLRELGFEQTAESKSVRLLVGSIDVRKLDDLARVTAVLRVKPVVEP